VVKRASGVLAVLVALALGGCSDDASDRGAEVSATTPSGVPVRIGTKNFTEQYILGQLYKQALEAKGFRVELKDDIGSSEITHEAMAGGALDMYPEYVDLLLSEVANVRARPRDPKAAYAAAKAFEQRSGFTLLAQTPFNDANALVVKPAFARRHRLRSIADLRRLGRVTLAAPPEFHSRFEGLMGLQELYGLKNVKQVVLKIPGQYPRLDAGRVDSARVSTTDGQLQKGDYTLLADPKRVFAANHVAPVISRKALRMHGAKLSAAIDAVSRRLTTSAMRRMNAAVDIEKRTPREVAAEFLAQNGGKP
jgi:osmoprotectant transport system substrate-binding protein